MPASIEQTIKKIGQFILAVTAIWAIAPIIVYQNLLKLLMGTAEYDRYWDIVSTMPGMSAETIFLTVMLMAAAFGVASALLAIVLKLNVANFWLFAAAMVALHIAFIGLWTGFKTDPQSLSTLGSFIVALFITLIAARFLYGPWC